MKYMKIMIYFIILGCGIGLKNKNKTKRKYENCPIEDDQRKFDVLPGTGWDNLANLEMGRILDLNFSRCLISNDNRYLIPNQLSLSPRKVSQIEMLSERFDHFLNYTSTTSRSINIQSDLSFSEFHFGGSFSSENIKIKMDQLESQSIITRVQLRYNVFQSMFEPDTPLYPTFKNRIMDIAALILDDKDNLYPAYLADEIIRDYGTHVIRSIDAGALLSKTDILNTNYVLSLKNDLSLITTLASASFFKIFNMGTKFQNRVSEKSLDEYTKQSIKTHISAIGSSHFITNFSLVKWEESIMNNLVPIDRRGDPIYNVLTQRVLPELSFDTIHKLQILLKSALNRYYTANARKGCMDMYSPNFNPDANIDGKYCGSPVVNFTLGGVYQTCTGPSDQCFKLVQLNPLTGSFSCPRGYNSVKLHTSLNRCKEYCQNHWVFWKKCQTSCSHFETFWCYPVKSRTNYNGYQFGGFLSQFMNFCPPNYFPLKFGINIKICVTADSDSNNQYAINFGGFYSCNVGNPLAYDATENNTQSTWSKKCADGYVSHIVTLDRGCQISYCTETNRFSLGSTPKLRKPPFIELNFNPNTTEISIFKSKNGEVLTKGNMGVWEIDHNQKTRETTLTIVVAVLITFSILTFCLTIYLLKRYYKREMCKFEFVNFSNENTFIY